MPFVKLDCGILESSLWVDKPARDIFITALLLAYPKRFEEEVSQIEVNSLNETGWKAPPGWYGLVEASGPGLANRAIVEWPIASLALERLGSPDKDSRSKGFDGRRLIRIDGGYIALNYVDYREYDYTAAERQKRWRERQIQKNQTTKTVTRNERYVTRNITQAEAEAEVQACVYLKRTLDNVKLVATKVGMPPQRALEFWNYYESSGWLDRNGNPIINWEAKLACWESRRLQTSSINQATSTSINGKPEPKNDFWKNSKRLEQVETEIRAIEARAAHTATDMIVQKGDLEKYRGLKKDRRELKKLLGL